MSAEVSPILQLSKSLNQAVNIFYILIRLLTKQNALKNLIEKLNHNKYKCQQIYIFKMCRRCQIDPK